MPRRLPPVRDIACLPSAKTHSLAACFAAPPATGMAWRVASPFVRPVGKRARGEEPALGPCVSVYPACVCVRAGALRAQLWAPASQAEYDCQTEANRDKGRQGQLGDGWSAYIVKLQRPGVSSESEYAWVKWHSSWPAR